MIACVIKVRKEEKCHKRRKYQRVNFDYYINFLWSREQTYDVKEKVNLRILITMKIGNPSLAQAIAFLLTFYKYTGWRPAV